MFFSEPEIPKDEYNMDVEVLMNDLFTLIKKNEELNEEIDRLKTEQTDIVENNRNLVVELETSIVEKAAEIQHQKHEIRRLSSVVETNDVNTEELSDLEKYSQVEHIREELEDRINDLESTNSELQTRLDEHEATKSSVTRQYETMKKKLQLEREQNAELNRQILEVSNLYDTYYMKCEEFEKGRIKGIENPLGDKPMETAEEEADLAASLDVVDGSLDMSVEKHESCADDESQSELVAQASDDVGRTCSEEGVKSMAENDDSNKRLTKQWSSKSDCEGHLETKSDSLLIFATKVGRLLLLVAFTFFVATTLRVHYGMEFGQILSTLLASYVFLYNAWLVCSSGRQSKAYDKDSKRVTQGLRKAIQDLIVRLDEKNFEEFSEIYEKYIVESFADEDRSVSYNVEGEVKFLRSSNEVLAKEVEKYKERNSSIHSDYNQMKREIDMVRIRRLEEDEVKEKTIQKLKGEVKSLEMQVTTKVDVASDAEMSRGFMQGSLLKLLLFAILEGMLLMSASSSLILIPASIVSVIFLVLVYRADVNLTYASNENLAYQRTVKELLRKVKEYRDEGKQTSDEVRELEAVVDKDYEIISKQRHAIERLERQLQRAINKYRDKKRMLAKFVWLQEQQVCDFVGLNSSFDAGEQHGIESVFKDAKMDPPSVNRWWFDLKTLTAVGITSAAVSVFRDYGPYFPLSNADPFHIVGAIALTSAIFIFVKRKFRESEELRIGDSKSQLRELRQDEAMMGEQVDMLRSLLSVEREFVAKIEKQLDATKEPSERRIPRSEVNAVIDRLIEVSKQRDALELSASSAKDKYDHIKKTLDDILSREKYLSEEVSALRTQKRELRNDLMKEQLKHIEMFEEVKRLKERSEKEVRNSDNHDHLEWDLDIAEYIKENEAHEAVMSSESEILLEDDAILEGLEQAGSHAQKSRRNRHAKRRHKEKGKSTREVEENNSKLVEEEEAEEKWQPQERSSRKVMDEVNEICDEMIACVEDKMVDQGATSMDQCDGEKRINGGRDDARDDEEDENYRADNSMSRDNAEVDSKAVDQESHVDENSLLMEIEKQRRLLTAKDSELEQLKVLLDTSQLSVSRENSDSGTERDYEKPNIDRVNIREFEKEIRKLAIEIFQLKELYAEPENDSDEEQRMEKISEGFINYLAERLTIFRCKFLAERGAIIAKMNAVEENVDKAQCQIEKLNADVDKEKQARNHVITEYENEYERLESRLSEAHENIRKRLTEERSLRGEIMTQYEHEIEDMQSKTMQILRDLKEQLKQERMEKEEAKFRAEETGKKLKDLEAELKSIEETEQSNQVYSELQDLFVLQSEGKRDKTQHVIQFKKLAEEEANRRTRNLKERLDEATRSLESFRSKLKEKEERITRFEKREKALMARIDIQDKRLTDLENEVRNPGTGEEEISTSRGNITFENDFSLLGNINARYNNFLIYRLMEVCWS